MRENDWKSMLGQKNGPRWRAVVCLGWFRLYRRIAGFELPAWNIRTEFL